MKNVNFIVGDKDLHDIEIYIHNITLRVGELVKDYRKCNKFTIAELSKRARVSSTVVTDLENGRSLPRTEVLLKLALALNIKFEILYEKFVQKPIFENTAVLTASSTPSLKEMIMRDGLGPIDAKEVMEYIAFKKFKNSQRK